MTAAEIETAFAAVPTEDRTRLLSRLAQIHGEDPNVAPKLTPEQIAEVSRRSEEVARGEAELVSVEETFARADAIIEEARRRQESGDAAEGGLADAA